MKHPVLVVTGLACAGVLVFAGPLNPPAGAPASTGKTTQEIYDAVQAVNSGVGGTGRVAAIPGGDMQAGSIDMPAVSTFAKFTSNICGLRCDLRMPPSTGGGLPRAILDVFSVTREIDGNSISPFRALVGNTALSSVSIKLNNTGGTVTYKLTGAQVMGLNTQLTQRTDGTFAQLETIVFSTERLEITTPVGVASYSFISSP